MTVCLFGHFIYLFIYLNSNCNQHQGEFLWYSIVGAWKFLELKEVIRELNLQLPLENTVSCKELLSGLSTHSHILRAIHTNSPWSCVHLQVNFSSSWLSLRGHPQPGQQRLLQSRAGAKSHQMVFRRTIHIEIKNPRGPTQG